MYSPPGKDEIALDLNFSPPPRYKRIPRSTATADHDVGVGHGSIREEELQQHPEHVVYVNIL
jgi:hypothetical protein